MKAMRLLAPDAPLSSVELTLRAPREHELRIAVEAYGSAHT
jgi:Zn-dependent alcohol dehydrogenase